MSYKLSELLPDFVSELIRSLTESGRSDLAEQLPLAKLTRWTFDKSCDTAYLSIESGRELNVVEQNIIGVKHGETVPVEHPYWVNVDTDNFGRLQGIEILTAKELASKLKPQVRPK